MLQTAGMAAFNDNMKQIVEETKVLQIEHKQTKGKLKKISGDVAALQAKAAELTAEKDVRTNICCFTWTLTS